VAAASASSFAPDSVATGDLVRYIYNFHKSLSLPVNSRGGGGVSFQRTVALFTRGDSGEI